MHPPLYVLLQKKHFDTIDIDIMSDTENPVPFRHGKTVGLIDRFI